LRAFDPFAPVSLICELDLDIAKTILAYQKNEDFQVKAFKSWNTDRKHTHTLQTDRRD